jgi:hypothetical protein
MAEPVIPPPPDYSNVPPPPDAKGATPAATPKSKADEAIARYRATHRTALDSLLNPQNAAEHVASFLATTALTGGAGGAAEALATRLGIKEALPALVQKALPALGRVGAQTGLGAAESIEHGDTARGVAARASGNALLSALVEAVAGKLAKPGKKAAEEFRRLVEGDEAAVSKATRAFERATSDIPQAASAAKAKMAADLPSERAAESALPRHYMEQLPAGDAVLNLPTLSKTPLTTSQAAEVLSHLEGRAYKAALSEIVEALEAKSAGAGEAFRKRVSGYRVEPPAVPARTPPPARSELAKSGMARAAVESGLTQPFMGVPAAGFALPGLGGGAVPLRRAAELLFVP